MNRAWKIAFAYMKYYKRQTLCLLLGVILSVALITGIGSLLYSGEKAELEQDRDLYGDWHYHFRGVGGKLDNLDQHMKEKGYLIEKVGILTVKKEVETPFTVTFVHGDPNYMEMMGRSLVKGSYPDKSGEVALDSRTITNLGLSRKIGKHVVIGDETLILCGIVNDVWDEGAEDMKIFVSEKARYDENIKLFFIKFNENRRVLEQKEAFTELYDFSNSSVASNWSVTERVGGNIKQPIGLGIIASLDMKEQGFTGMWAMLNIYYNISIKLIYLSLGLFSTFLMYSLYQISLRKRISQYSIMQTIGLEEGMTFSILLMELFILFLGGYLLGTLLGNGLAWGMYSYIGDIFINQNIDKEQIDLVNAMSGGEKSGGFYFSFSAFWRTGVFLLVLMHLFSFKLIKKMRKNTWREMIFYNWKQKVRSRRIYSLHKENLTGIIVSKFMFESKGTFLAAIIAISMGGILFLGTTYVTWNGKRHNELSFKADDGVASDIRLYEDSNKLSYVIGEDVLKEIKALPGIKEIYPVSYTLGEMPMKDGIFKWTTFYDEVAHDKKKKPNPYIMRLYNGLITQEGSQDYKVKTNVYGYSHSMLIELKDYVLEGNIEPEKMIKTNRVILKTIMDGQGNYDGIHIHPGDKIQLKVPKDSKVPKEALRFQGPDQWYQEKEFIVAAVVSRSLGKNEKFIGDHAGIVGIIMTNGQMQKELGVEGYSSIGIQLKKSRNSKKIVTRLRKSTIEVPRCLIKDYTPYIKKQNLSLGQKSLFFYGIATILLVINLFYILNSMEDRILFRKYEFGVLRALGITDEQFRGMLLVEGLRYGIYSGMVLVGGYLVVERILYFAMVHIFLYLKPETNISPQIIMVMVLVNLCICVGAVLFSGRDILKQNIIEEIRK